MLLKVKYADDCESKKKSYIQHINITKRYKKNNLGSGAGKVGRDGKGFSFIDD